MALRDTQACFPLRGIWVSFVRRVTVYAAQINKITYPIVGLYVDDSEQRDVQRRSDPAAFVSRSDFPQLQLGVPGKCARTWV